MPPPPPPLTPPPPTPTGPRQFPCTSCGGSLAFAPGTSALVCPYCGTHNTVTPEPAAGGVEGGGVVERDFVAELRKLESVADTVEVLAVKCDGCGAESDFSHGQTAGACPFCGRALVAQAQCKRAIKPQSLLPFAVPESRAVESFRQWIASLWFAPGDLKTYADRGRLVGVYTPAWTFDFDASTTYTGQRGDDYWTTETYTVTVNGRRQTRTRSVKRTRWSYASGRVFSSFDDLLVHASDSLPADLLSHLQPWDLKALVPYRDEYLAGFTAESYRLDLPGGFETAKQLAAPTIESHIRADIGGDHQRIDGYRSSYADITYKHLLLPVWISSYRYRSKTYRFLINARTGEVRGERPYSAVKITLLVLAILAAIAIAVALISQNR